MIRKGQKNDMEIEGMENANIKDAVALIAFAAELENGMAAGEVTRHPHRGVQTRAPRPREPIRRTPPGRSI